MISEERLQELRKLYPVGEPLPLTKNRNLILELAKVKVVLLSYWANIESKIAEIAKKNLITQSRKRDDDDDDEDEEGEISVSVDSEEFNNNLYEIREEFGIDFDNLPGCPVPLISLMQKYETPDDVIEFFSTLIDWLIQVDLDVTSEEFDLINIDVSTTKGVPVVIGYNPGMF
jgi:hypothetical protein